MKVYSIIEIQRFVKSMAYVAWEPYFVLLTHTMKYAVSLCYQAKQA